MKKLTIEPYSREFEVFWKLYPGRYNAMAGRKVKRKKGPAWQSWQKLTPEIHNDILLKTRFIKEFEGDFPRDPVTWLNQRGWDDIEFKADYTPVLPKELTKDVFKVDTHVKVDVNARRNEARRKLGVK